MLMTSFDGDTFDSALLGLYPEIAGQRVLVTGISSTRGIDMVRVFAEHGARLVLQISDAGSETQAMLEMIAPMTLDVEASCERFEDNAAFVKFARNAVARFGGIDTVINLIPLEPASGADQSLIAIEQRISDLFAGPLLLARVAANRMRLTETEGLVLNVACPPLKADAATRAFASVAKSTLAALTRSEAHAWAKDGIRFNAIAPPQSLGGAPRLSSEADMAALALYLAAGRGSALAGQVFEAEPAWAA